jgi:hypothetical protein
MQLRLLLWAVALFVVAAGFALADVHGSKDPRTRERFAAYSRAAMNLGMALWVVAEVIA